jgi:hypothetical protein
MFEKILPSMFVPIVRTHLRQHRNGVVDQKETTIMVSRIARKKEISVGVISASKYG